MKFKTKIVQSGNNTGINVPVEIVEKLNAGKKLIETLAEYCKQNNIKTMFVEAHEEDKHAIEFYHSAKGKAEKVVHFNFEIR